MPLGDVGAFSCQFCFESRRYNVFWNRKKQVKTFSASSGFDRRNDGCCDASDLLLAERFNLAVALIDKAANVTCASSLAREIMGRHPAMINSTTRIGLSIPNRSSEFRFALKCVFAGQIMKTLRADDNCFGSPLALQISEWKCKSHCLLSFQLVEPKPIDLSAIKEPFGLSNHHVGVLEQFTSGAQLADVARNHRMKSQTMRGLFSTFYSKFEVRNQLELLSALKSMPLIQFD